jgi:polysaccharide pyruvyl transferase WcaK-like protein
MSLRVLHAATHDHNIGDGALVAGMQATLREDLGREIDFEPLDVLAAKLSGRRNMLPDVEPGELDERYDLVLVGGGGMIEGGKGNYLSGINFNFRLELLEKTTVPWVFYALGFNHFRRSVFFHKRRLARLIELVDRRGLLFSVRNDGSRQRLERLLGPLPAVRSIPDPGLWVPTRPSPRPELAEDRPNLLVQLAGDRPRKRFGRRLRRSLARLAAVLCDLADRRGVRLVFAPHLLGDLPLYAALLEAMPVRVVREACTLGPVLKGAAAAPDFFELYRRADLVVGMRGHSVICAVGLGTPVVGLATHDKVGGFLAEVGLEDWAVDLDLDPTLGSLPALLEALLDDLGTARRRLSEVRPRLREETRRFHREIAALLAGRAG